MNLILFTLLFISIIFIVLGYIKATQQCPPRKIEYRFVPRTFIEDAKDPVPVTDIFAKMFFTRSPWAENLLPPPTLQQNDINKYFISQS